MYKSFRLKKAHDEPFLRKNTVLIYHMTAIPNPPSKDGGLGQSNLLYLILIILYNKKVILLYRTFLTGVEISDWKKGVQYDEKR